MIPIWPGTTTPKGVVSHISERKSILDIYSI